MMGFLEATVMTVDMIEPIAFICNRRTPSIGVA
jgi:hypothetical protein